MNEHVFVGFGFGPIQAGLFAKEAFESRNFTRIVISEIDQKLVDAVRANRGTYYVNVARSDRVETVRIDGVELFNPTRDKELHAALAQATEITTCLPSVKFFESDKPDCVAALMAEGLRARTSDATIVYAAENNNHAAEILEEAVTKKFNAPLPPRVQFLNTVIGKMSQVVTDPAEIAQRRLTPIAPGIDRAFLIEEFNRILVTKTTIAGFTPGIRVFIEKDDLLPFEEAKLYGHNAIHAMLGFIGTLKGYVKMPELAGDKALMRVAREAFIRDSGGALIRKYATLGDDLFTEAGYRAYADDLLERMTNPHLADSVARAARDVVRKLGVNDRIFGTMALALEHGIEPKNMAMGALAGVALLLANANEYGVPTGCAPHTNSSSLDARCVVRTLQDLREDNLAQLLAWLWKTPITPTLQRIIDCTFAARGPLGKVLVP
jgi:mannitol-1-phosphate 5-dehydrogenase